MRSLILISILTLAACGPDETISGYADPSARYSLTTIGDTPFANSATISFPEEGSVQGRGPCNSFTTTQSAPYPWFEVGPIATTRVACPDLETEILFFETLETMAFAEVSGPTLILSNSDDVEMVFQAE